MPLKKITYAHCIKELATLGQVNPTTAFLTANILK